MNRKLSLFLLLLVSAAAGLPTALAHEPPAIGGIMLYHFKPNGGVSGLDGMINLDPVTDFIGDTRCSHSVEFVTIDTVVYDGVSEIVAGFRSKDDTLYRVSTDALYKNVSNSERYLVKDLFKRGQQVLASYSVCGSGAFIFLNELHKVSAIKGLNLAPRKN